MTLNVAATVQNLKSLTGILEDTIAHPHGPEVLSNQRAITGQACVDLCNGDQDQARTLWKLVVDDLGGYMPHAAARALERASKTSNLVPDVEAPVPG